VALETTAFERAAALGWGIPELARRAGLSEETLYKLRDGTRGPGRKTIEGLLQAFPSLGYRDLFVPSNRTEIRRKRLSVSAEVAA
jgi:transcriptional regulator with XRE-family HTH domain